MNRFFVVLVMVSISLVVLAEGMTKQRATPQDSDKAPLMVAFADLKWTELPQRKGMQFALLSGDPTKGEYTQMRKVPAETDNPLHFHSSELKNVIRQRRLVHRSGRRIGQRLPGFNRDHASRLGAR